MKVHPYLNFPGNSVYIPVHPDSRDDADRIFNALSAGGAVEMPIADEVWGDYYGSCIEATPP